ncbi:transglycosylase family protein [Streptomyces sp. URMC 126]|uniref:transglycosylase family protein n=1 Tax=Streptomyces sp. URMC 126 TaxID=3423401 RepID=UPI003F1B0C65
MLSGKGRHRRPRQLPAVVVAAGVTGAGIAMPLLGATTADAADAPTWDRVAQCESGGLWSADTGNGFYGGLQLTPEMWKQYGGTEFAPRPDQASRAQQIAVAQRILEARGPYAWPACAVKSDLTKDGRAPEVNPGMPHEAVEGPSHAPASGSGSSGTSDSGRTRDTSSGKTSDTSSDASSDTSSGKSSEKGSGTSTGKDASSDRSADKDGKAGEHGGTDASGKPGGQQDKSSGGKHRKPDGDAAGTSSDTSSTDAKGDANTGSKAGSTADSRSGTGAESGTDAGTAGGSHSGTSASGTIGERQRAGADGAGAGKHRAESTGSGAERASRGTERGRADASAAHDYTVRPGDNLSEIAQQHRVEGGWHRVYQDNKKVVGGDPDLIHPGQQLELKK